MKVRLLAKQPRLGMSLLSSLAAGGRDVGGFASVGTGCGGGYVA